MDHMAGNTLRLQIYSNINFDMVDIYLTVPGALVRYFIIGQQGPR